MFRLNSYGVTSSMINEKIYKKRIFVLSVIILIISLVLIKMSGTSISKWFFMAFPIYALYGFYVLKFIQYHSKNTKNGEN